MASHSLGAIVVVIAHRLSAVVLPTARVIFLAASYYRRILPLHSLLGQRLRVGEDINSDFEGEGLKVDHRGARM